MIRWGKTPTMAGQDAHRYRGNRLNIVGLNIAQMDLSNLRSCLVLRLFTDNFKTTIDHHAPIKKRKVRSNQPPYINTRLRKAIWKRKGLYKKYIANRNGDTWEKYRAQINLCVDMRRKAMRGYLFDRTKQNKGNCWNSVKPFFTNKSGVGSGEVLISENSKIIYQNKVK